MPTGTIERLMVPAQWKAVDGDENLLEGYASTFGNVDLHGDVIQRGAFRKTIDDFRAGRMRLPFLADHRAITSNVLGSVVALAEDKQGLRIRARFSSAQSAQDVRMKLLEGHIDRMSIGYEEVEASEEMRGGISVRLLKDVKLWEISAVVFPANPAAVVDRVKHHVKQLVDDAVQTGVGPDDIADEFRRHSPALADWLTEYNADRQAKTAIGPHGTATSAGAWDGPAAEAALSNDAGAATYRRAYAWVDPEGDADAKAAYRFIHHEVSDGTPGAANVAACQTGIAVLNGARGGTAIPDADRQGVYNHLAGHLRDADVEPPELASADDAAKAAPGPTEPLSARLARIDALVEGRDTGDADPVMLARIQTRLDIEAQRAAQ